MIKGTIQVITLLNGQDIIGKVTEYENTYWVEKPAAVIVQPAQNKQGVNLALAPWPMMADPDAAKKGVHVNRSTVVTVNVPNKELLGGYNNTMSGLIVPSVPSLITE